MARKILRRDYRRDCYRNLFFRTEGLATAFARHLLLRFVKHVVGEVILLKHWQSVQRFTIFPTAYMIERV
jgi:hypothetical protein